MKVLKSFILGKTDDTPEIIFDPSSHKYTISGNSYCEDPIPIYQPLVKWLEEFATYSSQKMRVEFKMNYLNTSSTGQVIDLLMKFEEMRMKHSIHVKWFYQNNDEDLLNMGKVLNSLIDIDFELIEYASIPNN